MPVRYVVIIVVFTLLALLAWPYVYLYRLDRAVTDNDLPTMESLVDIEAVRDEMKRKVDKGLSSTIGGNPGSVMGWIQEGVKQLGERAVDMAVDVQWVRSTLLARHSTEGTDATSFLSHTTYAFFESYDRFLVRVGELGESPVHMRMTLGSGGWRVTGIYD
ncbi:MAG: DUF2939 domain-containing protein [Gammaproteobacteria bacterium]|nr:DUF2939 domain-containing protein [Gammaproteobacteria bacterium]